MRVLAVLLCSMSMVSCKALSPHIRREAQLNEDAASGRHAVLLRRAQNFESQNATSKDVHWYRVWRAEAMIGLGQIQTAEQILNQTMVDIAATTSPPAEPERLRMFILDQLGRASLKKGDAPRALGYLERSFQIAVQVPPRGGACAGPLAKSARLDQLVQVATQAQATDRVALYQAQHRAENQAWRACVAALDYPGLGAVLASRTESQTLAQPSSLGPVALPPQAPPRAVAPAPAPPPPAAQPTPPPPVASQPPPARLAPAGPSLKDGVERLPLAAASYARVDSRPYAVAMTSLRNLLDADSASKGASLEVVIRADGNHRALRIDVPRRLNLGQVAEIYKTSIIFLEKTRQVTPTVDRILIRTPMGEVIASRSQIFELFLGQLSDAAFIQQLARVG